MNKKRILEKWNYIKVFLYVLIVKLSFLCINATYWFNSDRIGDLLAPTTLAGLDWTHLAPHVNYYGYGFKWIYSIFFAFTDNPTTIYYSIMIMYDVLFALIGVLVFHILIRYLEMKDFRLASLIAVFMGVVMPADMKSEPSLYLAGWVVCFLIVKAIHMKTKKSKVLYAVWIALFVSYTMTLHERMLAIVLACSIIFVIYRLKFNEWIVNPWIYYPVQAISYLCVQYLNDLYRDYFWGTVEVANSSALPSSISWEYFTDFYGIKLIVGCIWSNLVTLGTQTYGLAWIAVAIFIGTMLTGWKLRISRNDSKLFTIKNANNVCKNSTVDKTIYAIIWIFGTCAAIVIVGLAERWGKSVFNGNLYGYKGFVYGRYYVNFAYPAIMAAIAYITSHKIKKRDILVFWGVVVSLVTVFLIWIYPVLDNAYYAYVPNEKTSSTMLDWLLFANIFKGESILFNLYVNVLIILVLFIMIMIGIIKRRKKRYCSHAMLIIIGLVAFVSTNAFSFARPSVALSGGMYDETYKFIQDIEDKGIDLREEIIYTDYSPWTLQYMLNRYMISYDWPKENSMEYKLAEDVILITCCAPAHEINYFYDGNVYYISLYDKEFVYFTNEELAEKMQNAGYNVIQMKKASATNTVRQDFDVVMAESDIINVVPEAE